jgi:hypothetical protein
MTLIAGSVDLGEALTRLARNRPIFHSEKDFQHSLAWQVHLLDPAMQVRLETRPAAGQRLDLMFFRRDLPAFTAVETKYLTALVDAEFDGEAFNLPNQGAQDIRAYDVLKDFERVESFVAEQPGWTGLVLVLTNDKSYWNSPGHDRATNAEAFRLFEGNVHTGVRDWGPLTGAGSRRNREEPISLRGSYTLNWRDFSDLGGRNGKFRLLVVDVA